MTRIKNPAALLIGVALALICAVTVWDAMNMRIRATYGLGADVISYLVAGFLGFLSLAHFFTAFRPSATLPEDDPVDWSAVGWVALALLGLIGAIWFKGGFILGSALLFAFTARAFGRRQLPIDLALGLILGLGVYLLFHGLLKLTLPEGPLEQLL